MNYLTIELIPKSSWFQNLRAYLSQEQWDRLRRQCYRSAGYWCEVCGGKGEKWPVECHEKWEWDEGTAVGNIQRLVGLQALCPDCHKVKHLGLTELREGKIGLEAAKTQLMTVNKWDIETTNVYIEAMFKQWEERSKKRWRIGWKDFDREVSEILINRMENGRGLYSLDPLERLEQKKNEKYSKKVFYAEQQRKR